MFRKMHEMQIENEGVAVAVTVTFVFRSKAAREVLVATLVATP